MIDKIYLDRAIELRKEYLTLNSNLKNYEVMINNLRGKVEDTISNLQDIIDNIDKSSSEEVQKKSMEYLIFIWRVYLWLFI